ncbi:hypothetical protein [Mycolicibacterium holsaticum]|uniref:hypothetical protein n=1 Tax=Mycolicibacterium holsaticum TaxID=152142 RepID=UPI001C7D8D16|nr:hypothetical protein [Mycolicibacterium holsaticum]MDA4106606.1 hypothetical protein [Mycolicibacterium holsaticum DSM 44478 = JCM 12374]QZA13111.1 hypothetical protein K3U96_02655 [Mycolicibacterium holsaticum DSM 44478 = JCM 12374]UNC09417.1 hypothetical protein H5U41_24170 [Mycolicibacterium holsaticum DSM 44478 = JCM 12374]
MTIDQVAPAAPPELDAQASMNMHFSRWVEQRRAEFDRERTVAPRVARMLATGNVLCLSPDERLRRHRCR